MLDIRTSSRSYLERYSREYRREIAYYSTAAAVLLALVGGMIQSECTGDVSATATADAYNTTAAKMNSAIATTLPTIEFRSTLAAESRKSKKATARAATATGRVLKKTVDAAQTEVAAGKTPSNWLTPLPNQ